MTRKATRLADTKTSQRHAGITTCKIMFASNFIYELY
nr:MAG TPA: hypothetical protein [Caudoviricetes sp.]DAM28321.1 MAG TPA: hypothetical protein [Caudoviricetes sp.]